jgi:ketosteroid isomerase-like protein
LRSNYKLENPSGSKPDGFLYLTLQRFSCSYQFVIYKFQAKYFGDYMKRFTLNVILFAAVFFLPLFAQENAAQSDILVIKNRLNEWVDSFNHRDLKKLQSVYQKDFLASYPNQTDQNLDITFKSYEHLFQNSFLEMKISIKVLEIEASENLAYVRLNQTSEVKPKGAKKAEYGTDAGIQIWKKQNDGTWQLSRSVMIPLPNKNKK